MLTHRPRIIGITGGIGAGKSAAANIIRSLGYSVIDSDTIAREIMAPGSEGLELVKQRLGTHFILPNGHLDRAALRTYISQNPKAREQLNEITHPRIQDLSQKKLASILEQGQPFAFYEAPLLFEAKSDKKMDAVICVFADQALRIKRIVERDHCTPQSAEDLLKSQMPQEEKIKMSEFAVENNSDLSNLKAQIVSIIESILALPIKT